MKSFTRIFTGVACLLVVMSGCYYPKDEPKGHDEPDFLINYQRYKPSYFFVVIQDDGQARRSIQSGPASQDMVPIEHDDFMLSAEQLLELEALLEPEQVSLYLQDQTSMRTTSVMIESDQVSQHFSIDETQENSEATQELVSFFSLLEPN